jgi:C-terminal processing protease CtpA/Prc
MTRGSESTRLQAGVIGESSLYRFDMVYDYAHEQVWVNSKTHVPVRAFNRSGLRLKKEGPDAFTVQSVMAGSPAAEAALKKGDRIVSLDGRPVSGLSAADATVILSRQTDTKVALSVIPKDGASTRGVQLRLRETVR